VTTNVVYQKTQFGSTSLVTVLVLLLFVHFTGWVTNEPQMILRIIDASLAVLVIPLLSLTIRVTSTSIEWWFTFGIARQRLDLSKVGGVRAIETTVMSGLGVHWSGENALWAVAVPRAVIMDLVDGRHIALSSNEPDRLVQVLDSLRPVA
jgi:hypothetical protein